MTTALHEFLARHRIHEVECVIPDMTGIARGKILPRDLFLASGEMRIPKSGPEARRVENRVPGVDANPYLAKAATLACDWLGMRERLEPAAPTTDSAWNVSRELPRNLEDALEAMRACAEAREVLGEAFVEAFCAVKELEYATYNRVISSWEREHLLLLV
jgi:glutamine synthetase